MDDLKKLLEKTNLKLNDQQYSQISDNLNDFSDLFHKVIEILSSNSNYKRKEADLLKIKINDKDIFTEDKKLY